MSIHTLAHTGLSFGDSKSVISKLISIGWDYQPGRSLKRAENDIFIETVLRDKLLELNPFLADAEDGANDAILGVKRTLRGTHYQNLPNSNQAVMRWLKGEMRLNVQGEFDSNSPKVTFIDFKNPNKNDFVVSDGVRYVGWDGKDTTFDIVLWINGIPVVVGEVEDEKGVPWISSSQGTWVHAARSIADDHESRVPEFFCANVLSFAIGKDERKGLPEFRFGAVCCEVERWERWGSTQDGTPFNLSGSQRVIQSVSLLLEPKRLLSIISDFTLYQSNKKLTPRYPQVEAVEAIYDRAVQPGGKQGLVIQHQGTGKTLAMAFAAIKLSKSDKLTDPMIVVVADRIDLIDQAYNQFNGVNIVNLCRAGDKNQLKDKLSDGDPKVLVTTIHKFRNLKEVNGNDNIIVLIDEAHRTQEGTLGKDMRTALPNARFFGFTGTPIADKDRNTFALFGDPDDKDWVLNEYPPERSLADGTIVPIHVDPRVVSYRLSANEVEVAFNNLVQENSLDEDEATELSSVVGMKNTALTAPDRIRGVCEAIVDHFYQDINKSGMKAQIVVYDRAMCISYDNEIQRILALRGIKDETAVVMSPASGDADRGWSFCKRPEDVVNAIKRFNDHKDRLKFLIVTSKLCTGFDAPIEGVMYLDKPMKAHTLFQTISRVNRKWTHPISGVRKEQGVVVDFIGLGEEIALSLAPVKHGLDDAQDNTVEFMTEMFGIRLDSCLRIFGDLPRAPNTVSAGKGMALLALGPFIEDFKVAVSIWNKLPSHDSVEGHSSDLSWLSSVYESLAPKDEEYDKFMKELSKAVVALTHTHIDKVSVDHTETENLIMDGEAINRLRELENFELSPEQEAKMLEEALLEAIADITDRLTRSGDKSPYVPLAEKLDFLYQQYIKDVMAASKALREALLSVVHDISMVEKHEALDNSGDRYLEGIMRDLVSGVTDILVEKTERNVNGVINWLQRKGKGQDRELVESAVRTILHTSGIEHYNPGLPSLLSAHIMTQSSIESMVQQELATA